MENLDLKEKTNGESLADRKRRYISHNLKCCNVRQLTEIEKIIKQPSEE